MMPLLEQRGAHGQVQVVRREGAVIHSSASLPVKVLLSSLKGVAFWASAKPKCLPAREDSILPPASLTSARGKCTRLEARSENTAVVRTAAPPEL